MRPSWAARTRSAPSSPRRGVLANYAIAYNTADFTIGLKTASVTPDASGKTYGATDPALTGTLAGFLDADGVTATYSRVAGETVLGGPYTISAVLAPAGVLSNYAIAYNTADFTIGLKTASVTPDASGKTYGATDPALTGTLAGFLDADGVTATYSRVAGETVLGGPYTISAVLAPAGVLSNYAIAYNTADFTIGLKTASVTPDASGKTYGATDPALTGTLAGFLDADGVTATYSRVAGETVLGGPYTISAVLAPAGVLSNYAIAYNTADFTIGLKTASVTPDASGKTYGATDPALTGTLAGFLDADGVTATYSRVAGETVLGGPYTISAVLAPAGVLSNYAIAYNTADFSIGKAVLSVDAVAAHKTYGESNPTFLYTLSGFKDPDTASTVTVTGSTTCARTSGNESAGLYALDLSCLPGTLAADNYSFATGLSADFTIDKAAATWTTNASGKTYGDADPAFTGSGSGFLDADGVTATYGRVAGEAVGPYHISATLGAAVTGALANYDITNDGATFSIGKAVLSVDAVAAHKTYGESNPTFLYTLSGFKDPDTASTVTVTGSTTCARTSGNESAGLYALDLSCLPGTLAADNYSFATGLSADFTIGLKTASVTPDASGKTYGATDPALTGTLAGFLDADGVTATYSRVAGETVLGGPYTISAVLAPAGVLSNYAIAYNTADFTIGLKTASVTPDASGKTYGATDPALTGTLAGFLDADGVTATYSRVAGETVLGGPYTISAVLAPAGVLSNYAIAYNTADFTIGLKTASVTPDASGKTYGATDPALTGTLAGFLDADGVTATYSRVAGETVLGGPYTISAVLAPAGVLSNYAIAYNTADFTIGLKTASVTPDASGKTYGATDPALTGTLAGFLDADGVTATYSRVAGETVLGGPYTISAVLAPAGVLSNYAIAYNTADFSIGKAVLSVDAVAAHKTYGESNPTFLYTLSGFKDPDTASTVTVTGSTTCARTSGNESAGLYALDLSCLPGTLAADNYSFATGLSADFTID